MKVAINGFGRIGRLTLRAWLDQKNSNIDIVAVNDLQNIDTSLHLLKYDSVHGKLDADIQKISEKTFSLNNKELAYFSEKNPENLPWKEQGIDLLMECTGMFRTKPLSGAHLKAGAKRVLVSCPMDDADNTIVYGVNHDSLNKNKDIIISNASCTTNCLAHVINALHREIGIANGFVTTIHSYTGDQRLIDTYHKDIRRARAAAHSMIPTSSGATKAIEIIFPELKGKLSGLAVRVPTANVSMVDFTFTAIKKITVDDIRRAFINYKQPKNVFDYTDEHLVSIDFNHSSCSAIVDLSLTKVIDGTVGHVVAWYDNEWGFSHRMLDTAQLYAEIF